MLVDALQIGTLGLFSAMGGWVLYTDFRYQKIRNRVLMLGAAVVAASYALALLATFLGTVGVPVLGATYFTWKFYAALVFHTALASAAALLLWQLKIWPAGDAKLFALFSLFLPLVEPGVPGFPTWVFMTCLINVFLPPAIWVIARAVVWGLGRSTLALDPEWRLAARARAAETIAGWRAAPASFWKPAGGLLADFLFYTGLYLVIFLLRSLMPPSQQWLGPLAGLVLMSGITLLEDRAGVKRAWLWPMVLAGAVLMVHRTDPLTALAVIGRGMRFGLTVGLLIHLAYRYLSERETRQVPVDELQPYQVLAEATLAEFRKDIVFLGEHFSLAYKDGIQPGELEGVKDWLRRHDVKTAHVYNTAPFAPWIVFGFCLTLALGHDIGWMLTPWNWVDPP